jgi:glutamine amidotransferase
MIAIIDYGAGNTKSLQFALERLGVKSILTSDPEQIKIQKKEIFKVLVLFRELSDAFQIK